jgi:hypothetical protein
VPARRGREHCFIRLLIALAGCWWSKHYYGAAFEAALAGAGLTLLRPARKGKPERPGSRFFKPLRQVIESVNDTFKGQLGLGTPWWPHPSWVIVRLLQRILALTTEG